MAGLGREPLDWDDDDEDFASLDSSVADVDPADFDLADFDLADFEDHDEPLPEFGDFDYEPDSDRDD